MVLLIRSYRFTSVLFVCRCYSLNEDYKYSHNLQESMDQPTGKVANPTRGRLNRENVFSLSPLTPENLQVSRDRFRPSCPALACSFSTLRLDLVLTHLSGFLPLSVKRHHHPSSILSSSGQSQVTRSHNCVLVQMAFSADHTGHTTESPPAQGQLSSR